MRLEIDIPEHHYNNIMAIDSINLGRVPYKGIIMYAINAIKRGKVLKQEPKIGYWMERHDDWGSGIITDRRYKCSVCHGKHIDPETGEWHEVFDYKYPFCPNCGAKMAETEET